MQRSADGVKSKSLELAHGDRCPKRCRLTYPNEPVGNRKKTPAWEENICEATGSRRSRQRRVLPKKRAPRTVASRAKQSKTDRQGFVIVQEQDQHWKPRSRFERLNVVLSILIAGWVPVIFMLMVSYKILSNTLESQILRDRQTFVQLIAHLVGDDLGRSSRSWITTRPTRQLRISLPRRYPDLAAKKWLQDTYFIRIPGLTECFSPRRMGG